MLKPSKNFPCIYDGILTLSHDEQQQKELFDSVLHSWTQRSLLSDYNPNSITFYDGIIGYVIRKCNGMKNDDSYFNLYEGFIETWKFEGLLYRVMNCKNNKIKYDNKIAAWTKNIEAFEKMNRLSKDCRYSFLVAKTEDFWGFDVNKYLAKNKCLNPYLQHEEEVVFPMDKKYIIDTFYGTISEFKNYLQTKK